VNVGTVVVGVLAVVLLAVVERTVRALAREVRELHATVDALASGAPTLEQLRAAVAGVPEPTDEPEPVVSRVPPVLRTRSVVKAMALGTGTAHAARRLRNGRSS
jgi:hypothetical protein